MNNHVYQSVISGRRLYAPYRPNEGNYPRFLFEAEQLFHDIDVTNCLNLVLKLINISVSDKANAPTKLSDAMHLFLSENNLDKQLKSFNAGVEVFPVRRVKNYSLKFNSNYDELLCEEDTVFSENEEICFTERELEILKLTAQGLKAKEISEILFISTKTVNTHKENIKQKYRFDTLMGAILYCVQQKIIDIDIVKTRK